MNLTANKIIGLVRAVITRLQRNVFKRQSI